jgi:hypothetical protein
VAGYKLAKKTFSKIAGNNNEGLARTIICECQSIEINCLDKAAISAYAFYAN